MDHNTLIHDARAIAGTGADFDQFIRDLGSIVTDVEGALDRAGHAIQVQGMARFRNTIVAWRQEIEELRRDLTGLNQKTQDTAQQFDRVDRETEHLATGIFSGISG